MDQNSLKISISVTSYTLRSSDDIKGAYNSDQRLTLATRDEGTLVSLSNNSKVTSDLDFTLLQLE